MKSKLILILLLIFSYLNSAVKETNSGIEFSYEAPNAQSVFVAGSLNDWNTTKNPLTKGENGIWKTTLKLSSGKYSYKFVVDGNWFFDQDNPNIEDDGYGGTNSLVEIDSDGKLVKVKTQNLSGVKSTFNPKVYFHCRYYAQNIFDKNDHERYYLDKPEHDLNLGIKIKFNNDFEGYTVLNINNNAEGSDMWKTHLNYKRTYLKLKTNYFSINAFDDYGTITSDDPLHIIGDEGKYHYDFGNGFRGVYVESSQKLFNVISDRIPLEINAEILFADELGDAERDDEFGRLKLKYPILNKKNNELFLSCGSSIFNSNYRFDEAYDLVELDGTDWGEFPQTARYTGKHQSYEIDLLLEKHFLQDRWQDEMNFQGLFEFYNFKNLNEFQLFEEHQELDSLIVKDSYEWMNGKKILLGTNIEFPKALNFSLNYDHSFLEFNYYVPTDSIENTKIPYIDPNFEKAEISRNRYDLLGEFSLGNFESSLQLQYWTIDFPDSLVGWEDYYEFLERTDGNGRWFQEYSEVPFEKYTLIGYEKGLLWKSNLAFRNKIIKFPFEFRLKNTFAHYDFKKVPKYIKNIVIFKLDISPKWTLYSNTRIPFYNDDVLGLKTDFKENEDVFYANYSEIMYHLSDNIRLSLGWGVNPRTLNSVTDEFYEGGREEFLEQADDFVDYIETTYRGLGEKIRNAEIQLKQEQRITLEAVVTF